MQALDELLDRWRKNPDQEATVALCAHLGTSRRSELLREVGNTAEAWHRDNHAVMLSVGRMYLDAGLLAEAQAAFVQSGKLIPNDPEAYRYLGEVLLRRGDAVRGEKALARAIKLGDASPEAKLWHERSIVYAGLQTRKGLRAVADEVARTAPLQPSIPAPTLSPFDIEPAKPARARRSRPPAAPARPTGPRRSAPPGPIKRRGSAPPADEVPAAKSAPLETLLMGRSPVPVAPMPAPEHPPSPFFPSDSLSPRAPAVPITAQDPGVMRPRANGKAARARQEVPEPQSPFATAKGKSPAPFAAPKVQPVPASTRAPFVPVRQPTPFPFEDVEVARPASSQRDGARSFNREDAFPHEEATVTEAGFLASSGHEEATMTEAGFMASSSRHEEATMTEAGFMGSSRDTRPRLVNSAASDSPMALSLAPGASNSKQRRGTSGAIADGPNPSPETVLLALARVGLYEADSTVVPAWEASPKAPPRRLWVLGLAMLIMAGAGTGAYRYGVKVQGQRVAQAQELGLRLGAMLDSGSAADLTASEEAFQRLFDLDSRSQDAAMLWLKNRAFGSLVGDQAPSGIESAMQRARTVGIEEVRLVFGRLAGALAANDLPAAGQVIAEWDARAKDDAAYQLLAGAVFERAGNPEALQRYGRATSLQPDLKLAHMLSARLALLQLGPVEAKSIVDLACARLGPGSGSDVLRGLEWAASPIVDRPAPAAPDAAALENLPPLMRGAAAATAAVQAQRAGQTDQASAAFARALGPGATPAMAAWIGYRAIEAGQLTLARDAAVQAMQLSVQHKNSQALAARIALADGRLEEAQKVVRGLDPLSSDAVLIEAVSAYENLQGREARSLLAGLASDPATAPTLRALSESEKIVAGKLPASPELMKELAGEQQIWGRLLSIDAALDHGRLDLAELALRAPGWDSTRPTHAVRQLRLRRYQGNTAAALELVAPLTTSKLSSPRSAAEAVLALIDAERVAAAASTLSELGDAAGALTPWLEAVVEAARGRGPAAAKALAELPLPGKNEPVLLQTVALRALVATKDRRAKAYLAELSKRLAAHPDVRQLAELVRR